MIESFAQLFEESLKSTQMQTGSIVQGTVVSVSPDFVVVNVGLKTEGSIPTEQFREDNGDLLVQVGDIIEVGFPSGIPQIQNERGNIF